jgi:hypothetical protein
MICQTVEQAKNAPREELNPMVVGEEVEVVEVEEVEAVELVP